MKIICVGGGPAGLYFAILMKLADPRHDVTVLERKPAYASDGWGMVFSDDLLEVLRASDPVTAERVSAAAYQWNGSLVSRPDETILVAGPGYSITRAALLGILTDRASELGVDLRFGHEVTPTMELPEADIVVAADGANSGLRRLTDAFGTSVATGRNKYVWLGTTKVFDPFRFAFVKTAAGWIWAHAYAIDQCTSTFIVECKPETWAGLGFDTFSKEAGISALEAIFGDHLEGHHLRSQGPADDTALRWLNFRTVSNARWHSGNMVLVGDAARTAHFSLGHGTTLAFEDCVALAEALAARTDLQSGFAAYAQRRRGELRRLEIMAARSERWFEDIDRYIDLPAPAMVQSLWSRFRPFMHRVPPKPYYRVAGAVDRVAFLRSLRDWTVPKARALYRKWAHRPR